MILIHATFHGQSVLAARPLKNIYLAGDGDFPFIARIKLPVQGWGCV